MVRGGGGGVLDSQSSAHSFPRHRGHPCRRQYGLGNCLANVRSVRLHGGLKDMDRSGTIDSVRSVHSEAAWLIACRGGRWL